jgi:hypothetical protein
VVAVFVIVGPPKGEDRALPDARVPLAEAASPPVTCASGRSIRVRFSAGVACVLVGIPLPPRVIREFQDRHRAMATPCGFQGDIAIGEAMT